MPTLSLDRGVLIISLRLLCKKKLGGGGEERRMNVSCLTTVKVRNAVKDRCF